MEPVNDIASQEPPICIFKPARYKAFVRLARQVVKLHGPRPIFIQNSRLFQAIGHPNFWVDIDLGNILEDAGSKAGAASPKGKTAIAPGISFAFQATESELRGLAAIAGKSEVTVWDRGGEIVFAGAHTEAGLQKSTRPSSFLKLKLPTDEHRIGEEVVEIELADLRQYVGKARYVTLLGYQGQIEQVVVRGKRPYTLYAASSPTLKGQKPSFALTSQNFLDLAGEKELKLGIFRNDHGYWLKTSSRPSLINNLTTYERLCEDSV